MQNGYFMLPYQIIEMIQGHFWFIVVQLGNSQLIPGMVDFSQAVFHQLVVPVKILTTYRILGKAIQEFKYSL